MSDTGPELQGESKINQQRKLKFSRDYVAKEKSFSKLILTCRFKYNTELDLKNVQGVSIQDIMDKHMNLNILKEKKKGKKQQA